MNFKNAYKNMTDEIHGDKALLHAILNGETKKKKRMEFFVRPVFATVLTAVFVLCITAIYRNVGIEEHAPMHVGYEAAKYDGYQGFENGDEMLTPADSEKTLEGNGETESGKINAETTSPEQKSQKSDQVLNQGIKSATEYKEHQQTSNEFSDGISLGDTEKKSVNVNPKSAEDFSNANVSQKPIGEADSVSVASVAENDSMPAPSQSQPAYSPQEDSFEDSESFGDVGEDSVAYPEMRYANPYFNPDSGPVKAIEKKPATKSSSGGSAKASPTVPDANLPEDMNFGSGVSVGENSMSYTAVSENNPERQVTVVVSESDNLKSEYPDAKHIQTENGNVAVIADNLTTEEINDIVDSLGN